MANNRPARTFGVVSTLSGLDSGIICNSFNTTDSSQVAEARDEKGSLIDLACYDVGKEVSANGLYVGTGLKVGTKVSIDGLDYLVTQASKNESNQDFVRSDVSLRAGNENTVIHELSSIIQDD